MDNNTKSSKRSKPKKKSVKIQTNSEINDLFSQPQSKKNTLCQTTLISQRSRRKIKKVKQEDSFISDIDAIETSSIFSSPPILNGITFEGKLIYRFSLDQIEFIGEWASGIEWNNKQSHQRFAYLMKKDRILFTLNKCQINFSHCTHSQQQLSELKYFKGNSFSLSVSAGNLIELLLIPSSSLLNHILLYLSGHYSGYFINKGKTIEDGFFCNFVLENNETRLIGNGVNAFGEFQLNGGIKFVKTKEDIIKRNVNNADNDTISLGDISLKRIYC